LGSGGLDGGRQLGVCAAPSILGLRGDGLQASGAGGLGHSRPDALLFPIIESPTGEAIGFAKFLDSFASTANGDIHCGPLPLRELTGRCGRMSGVARLSKIQTLSKITLSKIPEIHFDRCSNSLARCLIFEKFRVKNQKFRFKIPVSAAR
jgi:hypothetical protein